jgi:hypothetical protein
VLGRDELLNRKTDIHFFGRTLAAEHRLCRSNPQPVGDLLMPFDTHRQIHSYLAHRRLIIEALVSIRMAVDGLLFTVLLLLMLPFLVLVSLVAAWAETDDVREMRQ